MARYANVDIKIKGKHEDLLEAALFLKNHYDANDFKEMDHGVKLFSYIEQSFELGSDDGVRQLISKLTSIVPNISLNAVGIWENPETKEYQDFFYKYKNQELYVQTSDIYGKEKIDEEMTYEEFMAEMMSEVEEIPAELTSNILASFKFSAALVKVLIRFSERASAVKILLYSLL